MKMVHRIAERSVCGVMTGSELHAGRRNSGKISAMQSEVIVVRKGRKGTSADQV